MPLANQEAHKRFTDAALSASDDCIKIIGLDGSLQYMSEGGQRVMEVDDFSMLRGCPWPDFWQGQGNADALNALQAAREGRTARFTGYANTAKGNRRYWDVKVSPILGEDGSVESLLSVSRDITAIKAAEDEQALLRNELAHRIKNLLALVQSIAVQTLRNGGDLSHSRDAFLARLGALGRAHDLLVKREGTSTTLEAVFESTRAEHSDRIDGSGPPVELSSRSGLAFALALHELATNAAKYGALSDPAGRVDVQWAVEPIGGNKTLVLIWRESGGPIVEIPSQKGFGSRMIERALAGYVGGTAEITYQPSGVLFRLVAPVDGLQSS